MDSEKKTVTIFIRRAFDWRGGSGIELSSKGDLFIYSDSFQQAETEIKQLLPASADILYQIEPPMEREEFTKINKALSEWKTEILSQKL